MSDNNKVIEKAYALSEKRLEMQFAAATAADQRALSTAGIVVAAAAILCALAKDATVPIAMLLGSAFLVIAAGIAWYSARPTDFYVPGAKYDDLSQDIEENTTIPNLLIELGGYNDKFIAYNNTLMAGNSKLMIASFVLAVMGMAIAILPQILVIIYPCL